MKYKTIVIDPPWKISIASNSMHGKKRNQRGLIRGLPYDTMTDAQIADFPIHDYADEDCLLFMWCTNFKLPVAIDITKQWGFRYKAVITWKKNRPIPAGGLSYNAEYVVMGARGRYPLSQKFPNIWTCFESPFTKRSQKPIKFYVMLVEAGTPTPRIDIFGRRRHPGFEAWGNQVEDIEPQTLDIYNNR